MLWKRDTMENVSFSFSTHVHGTQAMKQVSRFHGSNEEQVCIESKEGLIIVQVLREKQAKVYMYTR